MTIKQLKEKFPSPIGDLFYLIDTYTTKDGRKVSVSVPYRGLILFNEYETVTTAEVEKFPSPIGDLFYLIEIGDNIMNFISMFPSPIGDLFYLIKKSLSGVTRKGSFRPLSGTYFI